MTSLDSLLRPQRLLALAGALLAAAALACGGGGKDSGTPGQSSTESPIFTPGRGQEAGVPPEVEDELRNILKQWGTRDARIAYRINTVSAGVEEQADLLFQWRPSLRQWRMDISVAGGESGSIINDGGALYLCDDAEHVCLKFREEESPVAPLPFVDDSQALADPSLVADSVLGRLREGRTQVSSRTIANLSARCFTSTGVGGGVLEKLEVCFAVETALLLRAEALAPAQGGQQDRSLFEATQVGSDVASDAFRPPYEVVDTTTPEAEGTPQGS